MRKSGQKVYEQRTSAVTQCGMEEAKLKEGMVYCAIKRKRLPTVPVASPE
jgi:hypothetical protein